MVIDKRDAMKRTVSLADKKASLELLKQLYRNYDADDVDRDSEDEDRSSKRRVRTESFGKVAESSPND